MKQVSDNSLPRRIAGLFSRNFGLKVLSLALAILIYGILKPDPTSDEQPKTVLETVASTIEQRHEPAPPSTVTVTNTVTVFVTNTVPAAVSSTRTKK